MTGEFLLETSEACDFDSIALYTYHETEAFGESGFLQRFIQAELDPGHGQETYNAYVIAVSSNPSKEADFWYESAQRSVRDAKIESYALSWKRCRKPFRRTRSLLAIASHHLLDAIDVTR